MEPLIKGITIIALSLFTLFTLCYPFTLPASITGGTNHTGNSKRKCNASVLCTNNEMNLTTICGNDGRTYYTMCDIRRAICNGEPVEKLHDGPCSDAQRCSLARKFWKEVAKKQGNDVFVPECNDTDGAYLPTQCYKKMGYCWCVDQYGRPIPGTSTQYSHPLCHYGSERISIKVGRRSHRVNDTDIEGVTEVTSGRGCTAVDRSNFNNKLYKLFEEDFDKLKMKSYEQPKPLAVMKNKFSEFDLNQDKLLNKSEVKKMKKKLREKMFLPRPCLRRLLRNCDFNCNGTIEMNEWIQCLGVNISTSYDSFDSLRENASFYYYETEAVVGKRISIFTSTVK